MIVFNWPTLNAYKIVSFASLSEVKKHAKQFVQEHIYIANYIFINNSSLNKNQIVIIDWPRKYSFKIKPIPTLEKGILFADAFIKEHIEMANKIFIIKGNIFKIGLDL